MKKSGILNAELIKHIAALGHKDLIMIGDAGMPIPKGVEIVDLALCKNIPRFPQVLDAVLEEMEVEYYYLAEEMEEKNEEMYKYVRETLQNTEFETIKHTDFKEKSKHCCFAVRTGEFSSYSNIILRSGVVFG